MPHLQPSTASRHAVRFSALVCLLAVSFVALRAADAPKKIATVEGITEYAFDNGLRLLLLPDQSQAKVSVTMNVLVGSRHEGYGETGMAHLLEHLVFKGTPRHPNIPLALRDHGAQFNGSTSDDRTNYYETLAATDKNLEFAIGLEADRLVNSYIKRDDLLSEMTVVRNEFERGENSAAGILSQRIASAAYDWHNYGKSTIGNRSDIERLPIENLREFYKKYYQPDNAVVVIAGKFAEATALELVQQHFGVIPRPTRKLTPAWTEEPTQDGERTVTLRRVGVNPMVGLAYHVPAGAHEDFAAIQVLTTVLNTRPSGRLYKTLIETKKATSAATFAQRQHDPSLLYASAEVAKDGNIEEVRDLLIGVFEGAATAAALTEEEVNRAKQQILKQRELASTDTAELGVSLSSWIGQGDWRLYFLARDRTEQVTLDQVRAVAGRYFKQSNRTVGLFLPTDQPDRAKIPAAPKLETLVAGYSGRAAVAEGEAFEATPANIESRVSRSELPDGVKVTVLPKKSRGNEVHAMLTLRYGNEQDLKDLEAAAGFLPDLMLHGTKKLSYQKIRDELDRLGATLSAGAGGGGRRGGGRRGGGGGGGGALGSVTFSIQAKRETLPAVLDLLGQVLREPLLPAEQFEIAKRARLANLEETRTEPAALGPRLLTQTLNPFPKDDIRYVPTIDEAIARLRAATHTQVTRLHRDFLGGATGELTIVGDFDPDASLMLTKPALADWKPKQPYARIASPPPADVPGSRQIINTPDKANATYSAGLNLAMRDDDPDYPALVIGNYILGAGTLASRLGVRIRQQEGLSYGVSSAFSASSQDKRATFSITAICNPQNMARLEVCVQEELARILKDGITADELAKARQGYLESLKVSRSSDTAISGSLANYRYLGRTMAWQTDYEKKINALTPESVNAALRRHLDPKKLVVVVAGDLAGTAAGK